MVIPLFERCHGCQMRDDMIDYMGERAKRAERSETGLVILVVALIAALTAAIVL